MYRACTWCVALAAVAGAFAAACSLGLDESLIGAADAGIADSPVDGRDPSDGSLPDGTVLLPDGGRTDAALPAVCTKDQDCAAATGCLKARCDVPRGVCVEETCRSACQFTACNGSANTCGAVPVGGKPVLRTVPIKESIINGARLERSIAALHPFVFLTTSTGVMAYAASSFLGTVEPDASAPAPMSYAVAGLGFVPTALVATGNRLFLAADPVGQDGVRTPLGVLELASDDRRTVFQRPQARSFLAQPTVTPMPPTMMVPQVPGAAFMMSDTTGGASLVSILTSAVSDAQPLAVRSVNPGAPVQPVAASGTRVVMFGGGANGGFRLVSNAGRDDQQISTPVVDGGAGVTVVGPHVFAQGPDGSVLWAHRLAAAGPGKNDLRIAWLLKDASDSSFQFNAVQTLADNNGQTSSLAWVDPNTAVVISGNKAVLPAVQANSDAHIVRKTGVVAKIPLGAVSPEQVTVTSSAGYVYILITGAPSTLTVLVPDCL